MPDRPEHKALTVVHSPAVWILALAAFVLLFTLSACGGGDDEALPSVADVAPELADLGDLATLHSQPVSETFGPDGGELTLADGARVEVPEGAFPEPVELTVAIVDVEVEDPAGSLRVYHLSTTEDIGPLEPPVVLEVQRPADDVSVAQLLDGEWQVVEVLPGPTTKVEIAHFTTVDVAIWTCLFVSGGMNVADPTDPDDPRLFTLTICVQLTMGALGIGQSSPTPVISGTDQAFINNLVDEIANDLERAGASNDNIATAKADIRGCLTDALEGGASRKSALDACEPLAAPYFPTATPEPAPEPQTPPPTLAPETEPPPPTADTRSLSVLQSSATFDQCDPVFPSSCFYDLEITLSYVAATPTSEVSCGGPVYGTRVDTQVGTQSGTVTLMVRLQRSIGDFLTTPNPVPVICRLESNGSISVVANVLLPPPS
ncbi:MAG: hypothetical protein IH957_09500 [Chloroflexi bacterium]|nr:hypothetical protein [Chloroflexota bacterium]